MVRCEECKAWHFSKNFSGFCKRKAPQPAVMKKEASDDAYILVWPSTLKDDGCEEGLLRMSSDTTPSIDTTKEKSIPSEEDADESEKS